MGWNSGFKRIKEERKKMSFFKIFQTADLSSETMRAIPYNFTTRVSEKDLSCKMVIRAQWGSSWNVDISKNPRFYYIEKSGWDKFLSDNLLGENEFVTFTYLGNMCFNVNIFEQTGMEMLTPRKAPTMTPSSSKRVKTEPVESNYKDVKKEEETGECPGLVEVKVREEKAEGSKTSEKKMMKMKMKMKKQKKKSEKVKNTVPEFTITIKKSYLRFLAIPKHFAEKYMCKSTMFTIHHPNGKGSWRVICLVRTTGTTFSSGWSKMAREYPLSIDDICTLKLIKPNELLLFVNKAKEEKEITVID